MIVGMLVEEVPLSAEKSRTEVAVAVEAELAWHVATETLAEQCTDYGRYWQLGSVPALGKLDVESNADCIALHLDMRAFPWAARAQDLRMVVLDPPQGPGSEGTYRQATKLASSYQMNTVTHHEWFCKFLSSDERMHPSLLWCPSSDGVKVQETLAKVDKGSPIVEFYTVSVIRRAIKHKFESPFSTS